jgi:hypothetical protein
MWNDLDIIEERNGFRVRLEYDDSPEAPYNDGSVPIFQLDSERSDYIGGHSAEAFNRQAEPYLQAFRAFEHTGRQVELFERYIRIFHGAVKVQEWHLGYSREYGYLAFDTAVWREEVGAPIESLQKEDYLSEVRAWAEGDVYGWIVERNATYTKTYSDGREEDGEEWETVDSCWGFYGRDYAEEAAKDALNDALDSSQEETA